VRSLAPDEAALWARVTSTIRPLSRDSKDLQVAEPPQAIGVPSKQVQSPPKLPAVARPRTTPGTTLDSSWDRKLRNGSVGPDRIVDLHGMSLDRAWQAIDRSLERRSREASAWFS
jgi:DNA-nicking Smr family endonuclease